MKNMKSLSPSNIILFLIVIFVVSVSVVRLFYGTEITDEAYNIAESRLVAQGAVPFVNNWTQSPGYVLLYFWLVPLYEAITGSTEGIFIFMRIAFFVFKVSILTVIYMLLQKHVTHKALILFLLSFVPFAPHNINSLSYNTLSFFLLLLSGALLTKLLLSKKLPYFRRYAILTGIVVALSCLTYTLNIIIALYFAILIIIFSVKSDNKLKPLFYYSLSGIAVAIIIISLLSIAGGGIKNLVDGLIICIKDNPYFSLGKKPLSDSLLRIYNAIFKYKMIYILTIIILLFELLCKTRLNIYLRKNKLDELIKQLMLICLTICYVIYIIKILIGYNFNASIQYTDINSLLYLFPITLLFVSPSKTTVAKVLILLFWIPCIFSLTGSAISIWSGLYGRFYLLYSGAMINILLISLYIENVRFTNNILSIITKAAYMCLTVLILFSSCISPYMYFYGDSPFNCLTSKVETGVYKHLYTTHERKQSLEKLENEINEITTKDDYVLFMETVPMAYLMTDAAFCTPSTWDIMLYSYGFKEDTLMKKYFETVDKVPNKIIYIDTTRDTMLSIETEDYQFNDFVLTNYDLTYETTEMPFRIKMFEKRNE